MTDEEQRRLRSGFVKKCEKLGRWPGDIRDFYKNRESAHSRQNKRSGRNGVASTAAMEETKQRYGREILSLWDEFEKAERHPDKIAAKQLHRLAARVDPKKTASRWRIKEWALNHLSIPPAEIELDTAPTRGAVVFLAACYENPKIREKLFEELIRGSSKDDPHKRGEAKADEPIDPTITLLDSLIEAARKDGAARADGELGIPSDGEPVVAGEPTAA